MEEAVVAHAMVQCRADAFLYYGRSGEQRKVGQEFHFRCNLVDVLPSFPAAATVPESDRVRRKEDRRGDADVVHKKEDTAGNAGGIVMMMARVDVVSADRLIADEFHDVLAAVHTDGVAGDEERILMREERDRFCHSLGGGEAERRIL